MRNSLYKTAKHYLKPRTETFIERRSIQWWGAEDFVLFGGSCRVTLVDTFGFCPKILGRGGDLGIGLCHSVDAG